MSLIRSSRSEPAEWIVVENSTCFGVRLPSGLSAQQLREDQQRVERRSQLVRHVREELALVLRRERELLRLLLERRASELDLLVLDLDARVLLLELAGLLLELLVRLLELLLLLLEQLLGRAERRRRLLELLVSLLELLLLRLELLRLALQLLRERLRLLEQLLGAHVRLDRVQHDADRLRELLEERQLRPGVNAWNAASSITAITSSSNRTGITMMLRGTASPSADAIRM